MITFISEIESVRMKTAENHYDYLIRSKQLPELKNDGRVVLAQPTTTNRTAITTAKLLRTHHTLTLGKLVLCLFCMCIIINTKPNSSHCSFALFLQYDSMV